MKKIKNLDCFVTKIYMYIFKYFWKYIYNFNNKSLKNIYIYIYIWNPTALIGSAVQDWLVMVCSGPQNTVSCFNKILHHSCEMCLDSAANCEFCSWFQGLAGYRHPMKKLTTWASPKLSRHGSYPSHPAQTNNKLV